MSIKLSILNELNLDCILISASISFKAKSKIREVTYHVII